MTDPISRFVTLLEQASDHPDIPEPTATAVATADARGRPAVRMLLLKGVDERGFVYFTNFESRKGREITENPFVALCFHWQPLELQVRVEGSVERVSDEEADEYFASRARGSQIGAWASRQSRPLADRAELEARIVEAERRYEGAPVPRPPLLDRLPRRPLPHRVLVRTQRPPPRPRGLSRAGGRRVEGGAALSLREQGTGNREQGTAGEQSEGAGISGCRPPRLAVPCSLFPVPYLKICPTSNPVGSIS